LACLIAGRSEYRWLNAAGQYLPRNARPITQELPARPAAVMIYSEAGLCRTLCLDFDSGKVTAERLASDLLRIRAALVAAGVEFVEDSSVSGGHHLYVPLGEWWPRDRARSFVERLAVALPSLDPAPHRSVESGCIRVPGSPHKAGGFQELLTGLADAQRILSRKAPVVGLDAVLEAFTTSTAASPAPVLCAPRTVPEASSVAGQRASRASDLVELVETGAVPSRYASPSEARMAALCSLSSRGWTQEEVWEQACTGRFQGLGGLYAKYSPAQQAQIFSTEWAKAELFTTKSKEDRPRKGDGAKSDMNLATTSQRGASGWDEHGFLRQFRSVLDAYDVRLRSVLPARQVPGAALLLRAVVMFSHMLGSRDVAVGCRNLAVATGMSHQSVAKLLRVLSSMQGAPLALKHRGVGLEADTYTVVLDHALEPTAELRGLARGHIHALRPVFRVLGSICALVYEGIERRDTPTINELSAHTGFHRSTVRDALYELLRHGMIKRHLTGWRIDHTANLAALARDLGALQEFEAQVYRYRLERRIWREVVAAHLSANQHGPRMVTAAEMADPEADTYWLRPPDAARTGPELALQAA